MLNNRFPGATPSQLGVRPSAELAQRLLTHAFGWMFAGLLLTAGVATLVQTSPSLMSFATRWILLLFLGQPLNDPNGCERFLRDRGQPAIAFSSGAGRPTDARCIDENDPEQQRRDGKRYKGELPVQPKH